MENTKNLKDYTMKELAKIISWNLPEVANNPGLSDLMNEVAKMDDRLKKKEKVKKAEFVTLAENIKSALGDSFKVPELPKAENSKKPLKKTTGDKQPISSEKPEKGNEKKADLASSEMFPAEVAVGDNTYTLCPEVKTMKQFKAAVQKGTSFIFAFYWSKKLLRQFQYAGGEFSVPKDGFKDNLDISTPIYVSDNDVVVYCISATTESLYQVMPDHFEEVEGMRYCRGIEFQLYKE